MTVDTEVITHAPTTTIVTITQPPTATVSVVETETVLVEEVGAVGPAGPAGPTPYEEAVALGFVGTEAQWLASLVGPQGSQGPTGSMGPTGPQGPTGSTTTVVTGSTYTHNQGVPATTWVITHGLGFNPNITAVDSVNRRIEGEVTYLDLNTAQLDFSASIGGLAYLS